MNKIEAIPLDDAERFDRVAKTGVQAKPFAWVEPAAIPRRRRLYGNHFIRQFVSVTVAPGGMGKSSQAVVESLAMVTGRPLLGEKIHEPCKVWLWNGEDPYEELQRRITAACEHHRITREEIEGRLFVDSGREMPLVVVKSTRGSDMRIAQDHLDAVIETIKQNEIDVLMIDPFVLTHQVDENSNTAIDLAARQWAKVAEICNVAVDLVHHVRKGASGQGEFTVEDGRGASALLAAARSARVLNRMTEDEGRKAGIDNHRQYFRVDNGKANLAPPADETAWRRIVSHHLPNGDNVGVVEQWEWPSPLEDMTAKDLLEIQKAIAGKGYRLNVQAKDWVGIEIARILELDPKDDVDRDRIKRMIGIWLKSGSFKQSEARDDKGKSRPIVEVGQWAHP